MGRLVASKDSYNDNKVMRTPYRDIKFPDGTGFTYCYTKTNSHLVKDPHGMIKVLVTVDTE